MCKTLKAFSIIAVLSGAPFPRSPAPPPTSAAECVVSNLIRDPCDVGPLPGSCDSAVVDIKALLSPPRSVPVAVAAPLRAYQFLPALSESDDSDTAAVDLNALVSYCCRLLAAGVVAALAVNAAVWEDRLGNSGVPMEATFKQLGGLSALISGERASWIIGHNRHSGNQPYVKIR